MLASGFRCKVRGTCFTGGGGLRSIYLPKGPRTQIVGF